MKKEKRNKGITLIALIITIIIMLILVGVTVSVALNGGLFDTAQKSALETRGAMVEEKVDEWKVNKEADKYIENKRAQTLEEVLNDLESQDLITAGERTTIEKTGQVTIGSRTIIFEVDEELELLKKYCLERTITDVFDSNSSKFINNEVMPNAEEDLMVLNAAEDSGTHEYAYVKYNDAIYKFSLYKEILIFDNVELIYEPKEESREGIPVLYDSDNDGTEEEWMILYDNGDNVEIVSMNIMGSLTLGGSDTETQGETKYEKAKYSYNNCIARLNNYCASLITNESARSVRSIGSNPNDPFSENTTLYTSETIGEFGDTERKGSDVNFEQDYFRMLYFDSTLVGNEYFIASRYVDDRESYIMFKIRTINSSGNLSDDELSRTGNSMSNRVGYSSTLGVRPVVKISSDKIKMAE